MRRLGPALAGAFLCLAAGLATAEPRAHTFTLANGLQVVVIPDHRVPVVTHMIWYRAGGADDPWGSSGIAHFLEHLMFKSTGKLKSGEFTRTITRLGGRDNAVTSHDTTSYFQRIAKEHLRSVMALEADRMANLRLIEEEVRTERDVIQEERRSTVEANPLTVLSEQMLAVLYHNHPYGRPVLGWAHEMAKLSRDDAAAFHTRPQQRRSRGGRRCHARRGQAARTGDLWGQQAQCRGCTPVTAAEPQPIVARRVTLEDARSGSTIFVRFYNVPSFPSARKDEVTTWSAAGRTSPPRAS